MPTLQIHLEGESCWPDLAQRQVIHLTSAIQVAGLHHGMTSGRPSVAIRLDLPDGRVVLAETSMRLFLTAARAMAARYEDEL